MPETEFIKKISLPEESTTVVQSDDSAQSGSSSSLTKTSLFSSFAGARGRFGWSSFPGGIFGKWGVMVLSILVVLVLLVLLPTLYIANSAKKVISSGRELQSAFQAQDLDQIDAALKKTKGDLESFDKSVNILAWMKVVPFAGGYWSDLKHLTTGSKAGIEAGEIVLKTIEPYADILGFAGGKQAADGSQTAEDRINFIVETVDQIIPQIDSISEKTQIMAGEFGKIDPNRYPQYFRGKEIQGTVRKAIEAVDRVNELATDGKPVLKQLPYLLGIGQEREYLFLWQNDKELRPTGGFITAYSIVKVKDGKIEPVASNDIYNLDNQFKSKLPAPEPIKKYLPLVNYWNLRDMNLSPDFKVSMDTFSENYNSIKKAAPYDGIISVDSYLLVDLLKVMGWIGVPGFGNFSAENDSRCNCPVVIYELESYADVAGPIVWDDISGKIVYKPPHADNRKAILGPLMNTLVANAMGQPKEKIPSLFEAGWNALMQKHVMFYFKDSEVQRALETFNLAGRVKDYEGDYLHINDTNFAGAKSNMYVEEEADLSVEVGKDGTTNMLTIKYKNPQKADGWLNGPYRDWFRVYVPKGSILVDSSGSEVPVSASEDLGKTVFEGFFTLRPMGVVEVKLQYKTPIKKNGDYKLLVQKQPGTGGNLYKVQVGRKSEEFKLVTDRELKF
ncbi:MAG: DUF4012 domain-containing protein [Candidatus Blackburnbacteria bacterium]|nr:DUF4012 domain-containing protein [Candidatus Blackburnbacteria bacterium]